VKRLHKQSRSYGFLGFRVRGNSASSQKRECDEGRSRATSFDRYISLRILWASPVRTGIRANHIRVGGEAHVCGGNLSRPGSLLEQTQLRSDPFCLIGCILLSGSIRLTVRSFFRRVYRIHSPLYG